MHAYVITYVRLHIYIYMYISINQYIYIYHTPVIDYTIQLMLSMNMFGDCLTKTLP